MLKRAKKWSLEDDRTYTKECDYCDGDGDVTGDDQINASDVVYLLNYLYKNGPAPSPLFLGDVNCDDEVDGSDVVYSLNYLYLGGPEPCSH